MFSGNTVSLALTVKVMQLPYMSNQHKLYLSQRLWRQQLPCVQIMLDFPEDPRSSLSSATYHQGVSPRIVEHCSGFVRVSNVSVRDNRNGNVLLNCPNAVVLSFSLKQAGAGASMNGQSLNATAFSQLGNFYAITILCIPAGANFQRNRHVYGIDHGGENVLNQLWILQQRRAGHLTIHLFSRAAHVDIDNLRA